MLNPTQRDDCILVNTLGMGKEIQELTSKMTVLLSKNKELSVSQKIRNFLIS